MRELKRSIARCLMQDEGAAHINRKTVPVLDKEGKPTGRMVSYFSLNWRKYLAHHVDPENYAEPDKRGRKASQQFRKRFFDRIRKNRQKQASMGV